MVAIVDTVDTVQCPVRDGEGPTRFVLAHHAHRQHAIGARRVTQYEIEPSQPPVAIRCQVDHLVDDTIAHPRALLARWTADERILRAELYAANARRHAAAHIL